MPVIADLAPVVDEIRANVADDEYVLPAQRFRDPGRNRDRRDYATTPASYQAIWRPVKEVADRAGVPATSPPTRCVTPSVTTWHGTWVCRTPRR